MSTAGHAKSILEAIVARYASMTSYSDSGAVDRRLNDNDPVLTTTFLTWFKKPMFFRFEFQRPHPYPPFRDISTRHGVGFNGSTAYNWVQRHNEAVQIEAKDSLERAIAAATGISSGSAHTIGKLLIPVIGGRSILELLDVRQGADTLVDSVPCYAVAATHPKGGDQQLLIEKDTLLIRRITTMMEISKYPSTELRDQIRIDESIDDAVFKRAA
jgi:hypothetical protein